MNNLLEEDDLKNKKFFKVVGTFSDKDFIFLLFNLCIKYFKKSLSIKVPTTLKNFFKNEQSP
jgi:hypothetical protein